MSEVSRIFQDKKENLPIFPQFNGVFVINKKSGPSSAHCLKIFKKLGQKKIGHAGTLDPFASGVLLALLGKATCLAPYLQAGGSKIYRGVLQLGMETDTWDSTGNVKAMNAPCSDMEAVRAIINGWESCMEQEVPPFSAAKHNGQSLYKLARKGKQTPRKYKEIKIYKADMLEAEMPYVSFRVTCGSGVYIRSLAHSLGKRLGCGACLHELTREYSYPFDLKQAVSMEELGARPEILAERLIPIQDALPEWEKVLLTGEEMKMARNGRSFPAKNCCGSKMSLLVYDDAPVALAETVLEAGMPVWKIKRGLWT